jgi:hypothetical protein
MVTIQSESLNIFATDGYPPSALLLAPTSTPHGVEQINAATNVPKQFSARFAQYLADHGVVYD